MINYFIRLIVCGLAVWFLPQYLKDISVDSIPTALMVAFAMSILNTFVKPILKLVTIPITLLTLGLFSLVISIGLVYVCHYFIPGFKVHGLLAPLVLSFVISITNSIVGKLQK